MPPDSDFTQDQLTSTGMENTENKVLAKLPFK